jgi:bifunctional non-homologous end joining protein LigD
MMSRMDSPPFSGWEPLPSLVRPMLASPGTLADVPQGDEWAHEMKWDGVRAIVYVDGGRARVLTRNDRDVTGTYPELSDLAASLGSHQAVLDGEIVAFDESGRPDFGELQQRMHVTSNPQVRALVTSVPVSYLVFDLLHLDGRGLLRAGYGERRELLEGLGIEGARWAVPPAFIGDGTAALAASRAQGLEGIVAKRRSSQYESGRRSRAWVKVKNVKTQEVVVGGWRPGKGHRDGGIGSLLIGIPGPEGLEYVGHVGTGFSEALLADLQRTLRPTVRATSPFSRALPSMDGRDAVWVTPRLVGEVMFTEWTKDGRLRHPSWRGLRDDKTPDDVTHEA